MATVSVNGSRLSYEETGAGEASLVLVHGSWLTRRTWDLLLPHLVPAYHVVTYDRRGHGQSERPSGGGSVREDTADLAGLIESLGLAPTWVLGSSFGASIALRLAGERPDLVRGIIAHEPPLLALLGDDHAEQLATLGAAVGAVLERIAAGDHRGAAERFAEVIVGPGAWSGFPPELQRTMIEHAPTFLEEERDPETHAFDLETVRTFSRPTLLTRGELGPEILAPIVATLAEAIPGAEQVTIPQAGHAAHLTHPEIFGQIVTAFVHDNA